MPAESRPRERLRRHGVGALSESELLALVLGAGGRTASATELAHSVLISTHGSLANLARLDAGQLARLPGIGEAAAGRIVAAVELGRRVARAAVAVGESITGPRDVWQYVSSQIGDLGHEEFHVVLLNAQNAPICSRQVTRGILDASLIHPREVFRDAIVLRAASMILVHNHPSGDPEPSREDIRVTHQLTRVGDEVGIPVVDHVIVAGRTFVSMASRGLLRLGEEDARSPWHVRDPLHSWCYDGEGPG